MLATIRHGTYAGTPLLPAGPFRAWILDYMDARGVGHEELGAMLDRDSRCIRRWLGLTADAGDTISEMVIEHAGIALESDPRLAARLYPELDW